MENQLKRFTFQIRYDDIKCRIKFYQFAPLVTALILCLCYISKFIEPMSSYKDLQKWLNSIMMIFGVLVHSKHKIMDIYGYLIIAAFIVLEVAISRNLKGMIKSSMAKYYKSRGSLHASKDINNPETIKKMMQESGEESRMHSKSNVNKFLIKMRTTEGEELMSEGGERRRTSVIKNFDEGQKEVFQKIEGFTRYEYDPDFLGGEEFELNPAVQKEMEGDATNVKQIDVHHFDSQKPAGDSPLPTTCLMLREEYISLGYKVGKLLYYFENRDLYLNCKMYYGLVYLMFRMAFFILISIGDTIDCVMSLISLFFLCYYWYNSDGQPLNSVKSLNRLAVIIISLKYLIGVLDIQPINYSGDDVDFESSIVLMFVANVENKNYAHFKSLIQNSLQGYWLLYECLIFVAFQLLIFFYTIILQLNTTVINKHTTRILYMTLKYIHYNLSVMTNKPFYINFERWFSPKVKYAEMFLKMGTIYLPIVSVIGLLAFAQSKATLPIFAIIVLSLFVIYQLIFNWMYTILEQKAQIGRYFSKIRILLWIYIVLGSASRILEKPIKDLYSGFSPLANITLVIVISLICFQVIIDLWNSRDFERFYTEFLNANKLSQIVVPLCEAYEFNEKKLLSMISNLKSKESLDRRIRVMEKQLKIWHHKFATQEDSKRGEGAEIVKQMDAWEKEIADLDKEEQNLVLEMRNEEYLMSQVSPLDRIVNYCFVTLLNSLNRFNMCPHLYLMDFIKSKNSEICKDIELKIYDYISQEYDEYTSLAQSVYEFYNSKDIVKDKLLQIKLVEYQQRIASKLHTTLGDVENKSAANIEKAADVILKRILRPKETVAINMTQIQSTKDRKLYFDSDVTGMKIRFFNVMDTGAQDFSVCHRMTNLQKVQYLLKLTPSLILDNFQGITLAAILVYCMYHPTILKIVLLVHVILNGLTEELNLHRSFWQKTFIIIAGISSIKLLFKSIFEARSASQEDQMTIVSGSQTIFRLIEFVCGGLNIEVMEVAAFLLTVLRIMQAQLEGCFLSYTMNFENISEAYMRVNI